jgi:type IV pilus assembly protein PilC
MAAYAYTAINASGFELTGAVHAPSLDAARQQLRERGLVAERLEELSSSGEGAVASAFKKVKPKSLQVFSRQFAVMVQSGLNVVNALVILEQQTDDKHLAAVIAELRADVEGGMLLSEAMGRHPKAFSRLYVSMVEAGETAGVLDEVLNRVALQIEKEIAIKRRVKGAMIYPSLVMTFAIVVLIAMLLFLVPVFRNMFNELGGQLPMLTQYVVNASNVLRAYWFVILPGLGGSVLLARRWLRSEGGRRWWDRARLRLPMKIGDVCLKVVMARFSRTLATLVASGVDIMRSLEITGQTAGNWVVETALVDVRERVHDGASIAQSLGEHAVFPPMVPHMVKVGEETGELDTMLGKIADFYEEEVDASITALTSIVEPLMMIGVGVVVGVVILSMYLPMFKVLQLVK